MKVEEEQLNINYDAAVVAFINANRPTVPPLRPEGKGVTAKEYADQDVDLNTERARKLLDQMVEKGKLVKERMRISGRAGSTSFVYFRSESKPEREE